MCGIAGVAGRFHEGLVSRMNQIQSHRGPDGSGLYEDADNRIALGHVRLAILDTTDAAAQPMFSPCGRYVLVFNGEIYNFAELRKELGDPPESYRSSGDTEVLLRGLVRHGIDFAKKLNGIFAFAYWDRDRQELFLCRDQLGIKPLYVLQSGGELAFASEMKAILLHPRCDKELDHTALRQHLLYCHAAGNRTILKNVRRLPAGSYLKWDSYGGIQIRSYWEPRYSQYQGQESECIEEMTAAVERAIQRQLVSDVPVGVMLSGGLDSSLVAAVSAPHMTSLSAFTTVAAGATSLDGMPDDVPFAQSIARSFGMKHYEVPLQAKFTEMLPKLIWHLDEPIVDPAIVNCYLISECARQHGVKVLLSGQGADELFGGYPRYRAAQIASMFSIFPVSIRRLIGKTAQLIPGAVGGPIGPSLRRARRLLSELPFEVDERFLRYCSQSRPEVIQELMQDNNRGDLQDPFSDCFSVLQTVNDLNRFIHRDVSVYLPNHNLLYTDKMGMAAGVEIRVPLLDMELVELANSLPFSWKVSGELKRILRKVSRRYLPGEILNRRKAGFGAPFRSWLRHELAEVWDDVSSPSSIQRRGWFDPQAVSEIRKASQSGKTDLYLLQWGIITMELWARKFLDESMALPVNAST